MEAFFNSILSKIGDFTPFFVTACVVYVVGRWVTALACRIVAKTMEKKQVDITVQNFVNQLIKWLLNILLILAVVQILGLPVSSFLGALTASAVAIGLALQGSLSNLAGGIMLLIIKPFKIGDLIQAKGHTGTVNKIGMFYTYINKFDNELVMIPNGPLFADSVVNFSKEKTRRVRILVGVSYNSDMRKVKNTLMEIGNICPYKLKEIETAVFVEELAESSVNVSVRIWVNQQDYYSALYNMTENIKSMFDAQGIEIPFPHREILLKK